MNTKTKDVLKYIIGKKASLLEYAYARIFTKSLNQKEWTNSTLEGYLCLIYDRKF